MTLARTVASFARVFRCLATAGAAALSTECMGKWRIIVDALREYLHKLLDSRLIR